MRFFILSFKHTSSIHRSADFKSLTVSRIM